jgi:glutathionylspermidine synthase
LRRQRISERPGWRQRAQQLGFSFHHDGGQRYWDERAVYLFTLEQIETHIEPAAEALHAMCLELVADVVRSEKLLTQLAVPQAYWDMIAQSWQSRAPSLYGRFDFAYDGMGPPKLLEYNADTPTSIFETGVFQWDWLEQMIAVGRLPADADQFNALHEALIRRFGEIFQCGSFVHFTSIADHVEDRQTVRYLEDLAFQAGLQPHFVAIDRIGIDQDGWFVDDENALIRAVFKLYPWEDLLREPFAEHLPTSQTLFLEPAWKAILSNKGILALLWERHLGHPNLLPAFFDGDAAAATLGRTYVRKPLFSREGWDIEIVDRGRHRPVRSAGYGGEGHVIQGLAQLPRFDGNFPIVGAWIVGTSAVGMAIREDRSRITRNLSRFIPHAIVAADGRVA